MKPPRATYRLQLNKDFTLRQATALVPYLDRLGVSHAYLSPVLKAQPGSTHGYDTVDHTCINPEIGTLSDFEELAAALKARDMGIILDFVPNHMGVGGACNALWLDVLRHGPASRYAPWFDIDWNTSRTGMTGKLLVPFLGKSRAEVLADEDIALKVDGDGFAIWAYDKEKLPLRPEDAHALLAHYGSGDAVIAAHRAPAAIEALMDRQHWRLAHFATAQDELNYRRFFINSELAGIRVERPDVFDHIHGLIFSLIESGFVEGLRIDHVDGLRDPLGYFTTLRNKVPRPIYLAVEKILAPHEALRGTWPVDGTTGYEVGAQLTRILTQKRGEAPLTAAYHAFVGPVPYPREEAHRCKLRVMDNELAVELKALAHITAELAWSVAATSDLTEGALRRAWRETIAQLDVYRTYCDQEGVSARDRRELSLAVARARQSQQQIQPSVFDFLHALLNGTLRSTYDSARIANVVDRFQRCTGPVMAKGLEDTALYRYNRLVSLNEVGAHPERFSLSIDAFHDSNRRRLHQHPNCLIGTSTHDTKRGEDIRLVIASLSDDPVPWTDAAASWRYHLGKAADGVHPNDLYLLFQLLLGGWPMHGNAEDLPDRLKAAMTKSLREARQRSDWGVNNLAYEQRVASLIDAMLGNEEFLSDFHRVRSLYAAIGRRKALIHAVLKFTIPGVPDIYRGAEDWEQSFVDPDNRRPLDFSALSRRLDQPVAGKEDKLLLTQNLLSLRRRHHALFAAGSYEPLDCGSTILAFQRRSAERTITVAVDLSPGHCNGLENVPASGRMVIGSRAGPFLVAIPEGDKI